MSTEKLDPRRHAYREDLAAEQLRGRVAASRYAAGQRYQAARAALAVRLRPEAQLGLETEMLFGEVITVYDVYGGWAWGQLERDGYVGYVPADALSPKLVEPTHRVSALGTFIYTRADYKSAPLMHVSINTPLAVAEQGEVFSRLANGGYVHNRHIRPADRVARDFVAVAEQLIGVPYLWGGRTRVGVDCSGLVQLSMEAAGIAAPRDSDMQQAEIGADVLVPQSLEGLERGDLVFWDRHVGIMTDGVMMAHANAYHMAVVIEPLAIARKRIARFGTDVRAIKRPPALTRAPAVPGAGGRVATGQPG